MLCRLFVKNVALIEEADIQFDAKLNVLSGETGSGKSVLLDSINFVLGSKADTSMIRYGADEAFVRAEFSLSAGSAVNALLSEMDIDVDDETLIITRKLSSSGRGSVKINGCSATGTMLKKIAAHLVDVHGQSEHFYLLSEANQLNVVDALCGQNITDLKLNLGELLNLKKQYLQKKGELGGSEQERAQRLDLLSFQIDEIEKSDVHSGEIGLLKQKKKIFDNAEKVVDVLSSVKDILSSDDGCIDMLSLAKRQASGISDISSEYDNIYDRLESLFSEAQDVSETVTDLIDGFSYDEEEASRVDERLDLYRNLIKKYGRDEDQILEYLQKARTQYDALLDSAAELERLDKDISEVDCKIYSVCQKMTELRKDRCENLCSEIIKQLKSMNIPNAEFYVEFGEYDQSFQPNAISGGDKITFMFSANRGEPPKPLNKIISGGEMSRFMLAIKTQLKQLNGISTYIFDEIDAGISGITARLIAEKLVSISKDTQIIAVSHLPQVCAAASVQYLISKSDDKSKTVTNVRRLTREERVKEIIRLTGSIETDAAKVHADELLKQFNN